MTLPYRVLIIDDDSSLLFGLSVIMKRAGYEVITGETGKEGLELAQSELPDIILSDVMMPSPNGFELRKLLNQEPSTAEIPFIFLTAKTDQEDKIIGIRSGADDYITKPFDRQELVVRVEAVLRRAKLEREKGRSEVELLAEKKMDALRHEILQNIQHELRTPVSNVLMPLEAAISNKFDDPEDQIKFTQSALSNAQHLQFLIEDLITLTNIDQGNLNNIRQEIKITIDIMNPILKRAEKYQNKNLKIIYDIKENDPVYAPRIELRQAIVHLTDNAFKFSPIGGKVFITLKPNDGGCKLSIRDEGPGIPKELREKVFERYYQISHGSAREYGGLGVGLTIAQAITHSLDGTIEIIDSSKGCHINLYIPPGNNQWLTTENP